MKAEDFAAWLAAISGMSSAQRAEAFARLEKAGAGGAEIGTVGQENDVPGGLLDGAWGDLAYSVAIAAGDVVSLCLNNPLFFDATGRRIAA